MIAIHYQVEESKFWLTEIEDEEIQNNLQELLTMAAEYSGQPKNRRPRFNYVILIIAQALLLQKHNGLTTDTLESLLSSRPHLPLLTNDEDDRLWDIRPLGIRFLYGFGKKFGKELSWVNIMGLPNLFLYFN